jgi:glutathione S-transferase
MGCSSTKPAAGAAGDAPAPEPAPAAAGEWKIEPVPDGGFLLCGHPGSGNVISIMLFCSKHLEKDKYKFQMCDIMQGHQMSPDFLAMNPFHQVPSGKSFDGTCLYESSATLRYLARKFSLDTYPVTKQLLIDMAMDKRQTDLYAAWTPIGYYAMQLPGFDPPPADASKKLNAVLAMMEQAFLQGKYVGGDKLCIADYSILPLINTLTLSTTKAVGYTLPARWAKYLEDAKADLGPVFTECAQVHEGWVGSNETKVKKVVFDADEPLPGASVEWKMEEVPADGVLLAGHPGSGNVISVMLFLNKHANKDKYKFQMCDIMKGEQMSADFLAMTPFHQMPAAKLSDGTCLYESSAMLRCLAQKLKLEAEVYSPDQQVIIDTAMDKRQTDFYKAWSPIGYYAMQLPGMKPPPADAAKKLNTVLEIMDKAFFKDGNKYLAGAKLTIADYSILPFINTLSLPTVKKIGYELLPRWAKYLADAKEELGAVFTESTAVHEGWVGSNEGTVETVKFDTSTTAIDTTLNAK